MNGLLRGHVDRLGDLDGGADAALAMIMQIKFDVLEASPPRCRVYYLVLTTLWGLRATPWLERRYDPTRDGDMARASCTHYFVVRVFTEKPKDVAHRTCLP